MNASGKRITRLIVVVALFMTLALGVFSRRTAQAFDKTPITPALALARLAT